MSLSKRDLKNKKVKMSKQYSRIFMTLDANVKLPPTMYSNSSVSDVKSTKKPILITAIPIIKHSFATKFTNGKYKCSLNFYDYLSFL